MSNYKAIQSRYDLVPYDGDLNSVSVGGNPPWTHLQIIGPADWIIAKIPLTLGRINDAWVQLVDIECEVLYPGVPERVSFVRYNKYAKLYPEAVFELVDLTAWRVAFANRDTFTIPAGFMVPHEINGYQKVYSAGGGEAAQQVDVKELREPPKELGLNAVSMHSTDLARMSNDDLEALPMDQIFEIHFADTNTKMWATVNEILVARAGADTDFLELLEEVNESLIRQSADTGNAK